METTIEEPGFGVRRRGLTTTPEDRLPFARRLILMRCRWGMTLGKLSAQCGVSERQLCQLEGGGSMPTSSTVLKLAKALSYPPGSFFKPDRRDRENRFDPRDGDG